MYTNRDRGPKRYKKKQENCAKNCVTKSKFCAAMIGKIIF